MAFVTISFQTKPADMRPYVPQNMNMELKGDISK